MYIIYKIGDSAPTGDGTKADIGGCAYLKGDSVTIQNSNFTNCQARQGGGLAIFNNNPQNSTSTNSRRNLSRNLTISSAVQVYYIYIYIYSYFQYLFHRAYQQYQVEEVYMWVT